MKQCPYNRGKISGLFVCTMLIYIILVRLLNHVIKKEVQLHASCAAVLLCLSISSQIGLVAQNVAVGMALTSPVMNRTGASDERGTKSVTTTCAAGATRDVVNVSKENVEDQETVQR